MSQSPHVRYALFKTSVCVVYVNNFIRKVVCLPIDVSRNDIRLDFDTPKQVRMSEQVPR